MALEDLTGATKYLNALVPTNPDPLDAKSQGDDHIRGIKNVLLNTFGPVSAPVPVQNIAFKNVDEIITGNYRFNGNTRQIGTYTISTTSTSLPVTVGSTTPKRQTHSTTTAGAAELTARYTNDASGVIHYDVKSRDVIDGFTVPINANDQISNWVAAGATGAGCSGANTYLLVSAAQNWTPSSTPTKISIRTTRPGAVTSSDSITVDENGVTRVLNRAGGMQEVGVTPGTINLTSSRSVSTADAWNTLRCTATLTLTLTDVCNSGDRIDIRVGAGATLTIAGSGVTITWLKGGTEAFGNRTVAASSIVTLHKESPANWSIWGNGIS